MKSVDASEEVPLRTVQGPIEQVGLRRDHRDVKDLVSNVDSRAVRVNQFDVFVEKLLI